MIDHDQVQSIAADAVALLARIDAAAFGADGADACATALLSAGIKVDGAIDDLRRAAGDEGSTLPAELAAMRTLQ